MSNYYLCMHTWIIIGLCEVFFILLIMCIILIALKNRGILCN